MRSNSEEKSFISSILKGIGQIVFQENIWSGILILLGLFVSDWRCGIGAILGSTTGTLTAKLLHFDNKYILSGVYGFNASLVGIAVFYFFSIHPISIGSIFIGGICATIIQYLFLQRNIPVYTLPFILITWTIYWSLVTVFPISLSAPSSISSLSLNTYSTGINGFSQIVFQENVLAGILILIAIAINDLFKTTIGFVASLLAAVVTLYLHQEPSSVLSGVFGFNVILTSLAVIQKNLKSIAWTLFGCLTTLSIHIVLLKLSFFSSIGGLLTLPFVIGTWCVLVFQNLLKKK